MTTNMVPCNNPVTCGVAQHIVGSESHRECLRHTNRQTALEEESRKNLLRPNTTKENLKRQMYSWAVALRELDADVLSSEDVLDVEFKFSREGQFRGGEILLATGGPHITYDLEHGAIAGTWGGEDLVRPIDKQTADSIWFAAEKEASQRLMESFL